MGLFKKLFRKNNNKNKYNIKAEDNEPREVYGIPDPNMFNNNQPRRKKK